MTIASTLLLDTDIRGGVEYAEWYFETENDSSLIQRRKAMEALLLTQGWSRYDMPSSISADFQEPESPLEKGAEMSGIVKSRWRGKPLENAVFNVIAPQVNFGALAVTDSTGRFTLPYPDHPEGTRYLLQSINTYGDNEENFRGSGVVPWRGLTEYPADAVHEEWEV